MKAYITKYALTKGILEMEVEQSHTPTMVVAKGSFSQYFHGEGKEWHRTLPEAQNRAEEMRKAKIASLKKSIAKFEKLKFVDKFITVTGVLATSKLGDWETVDLDGLDLTKLTK